MKNLLMRVCALALALLALPASAQIDPNVTGLPAASTPAGTEIIPCIQGGQRKACTLAQLSATRSNIINRDPAYIPKWRLALAKYRTSVYRAKILFVGDSKDVGIGAGTGSDGQFQSVGAANRNKTTYFAQMLAERGYNVNRQSWCGAAGLASYTAINNYDPRRVLPSDAGFGGNTLGGALAGIPSGITSTITLTPDPSAITNAVDLLAYQRAAAGTAAISDGTTSASQNLAQATDAVARVSFTGYSRGAGKTYSLTRSAGGAVQPICAIAYDSTVSQIEIVNAGISGVTTGGWTAGSAVFSPLAAIQAYTPDLTVIQLGTNDMNPSSNISASGFGANLSTIILAAKVSGDCVVELPTQPQSTSAGYANYPSYIAVARDTATSAGCVVIDHGGRLGAWATASLGGFMFDGLHETANGYADEARALADALIL